MGNSAAKGANMEDAPIALEDSLKGLITLFYGASIKKTGTFYRCCWGCTSLVIEERVKGNEQLGNLSGSEEREENFVVELTKSREI
jgi:hypothetical protein